MQTWCCPSAVTLWRVAFKRYSSLTATLSFCFFSCFVQIHKELPASHRFFPTSRCDEMLSPRFEVATDWSHAAPSSRFFVRGIKWCCCDQNVILSSIVAFKWIDSFISINAEKKKCHWRETKSIHYLVCVWFSSKTNKKNEHKEQEQSRCADVKMSRTTVLKPLKVQNMMQKMHNFSFFFNFILMPWFFLLFLSGN